MFIELSRSEFLQKIQAIDLTAGEWLAVCLVIRESLNNLNIARSEQDGIVELGKQTFSGFREGFFGRIGWTTYIACIKDEKESVIRLIDNNLREMTQKNQHCGLWNYNIAKVEGNPSNKIMEIEWKTNKGIKYED